MSELITLPPDKFPVMAELQQKYPDKVIIHAAIQKLKTMDQIVAFANEFTNWVDTISYEKNEQETPPETAGRLISFALGNYDKDTIVRWNEALPQMGPSVGAVPSKVAVGSEAIAEALQTAFQKQGKKTK